jgi:serine/threonine protein kinase
LFTFVVYGARNIQKKLFVISVVSLTRHLLTCIGGYGKPVDIWAMGVITYFLLAGYTPFFAHESQQQEMEAMIAGDYKFEPEEYWQNVSPTAKDFVRVCLTVDPAKRPTAETALQHKVGTALIYF